MVDDVLTRLQERDCRPRKSGAGWSARCPSHDDKNPSLSISEGTGGGVVVHCHAGCTPERVCHALGLELVDLAPPRPASERIIVAMYDYHRADGELDRQVVRFDPKDFRQRRPDGSGGWIWNTHGLQPILYHLPQVIAAVQAHDVVWVAEGEKDADALTRAGVVATTNPGGAGKWKPEHTEQLRGAQVVIVADRDDAGRKHARLVAAELAAVAASVSLIEAADGKDAADHLAHGRSLGDFRPLTQDDLEQPSTNGNKPHGRFRHLTTQQLLDLRPPSFLLEPFLVRDALNLLFGPSGTYKSFIAIDWALCIASGQPWHGTPVQQGPVLYIAGEGSSGIPKRLRAWARARNTTLPDAITWIPETVPLREDAAVDELVGIVQAQPQPPALIVIETYARSLAGGNENSSEDGGKIVTSLDRVRIMTGAAILMTHHTGWEHTTRERGWSGLPAALDSSIRVSRPAPLNVVLHCQKAKDAEEFDDMHLTLEPVESSLVVGKRVDPTTEQITIRRMILAFVEQNPGATKREILDGVTGVGKPAKAHTLAQMCEGAEAPLRIEKHGQAHYHFPNRAPASGTVRHGSERQPYPTVPEADHTPTGWQPGHGVGADDQEPFPDPDTEEWS